MLIPIQIGLLRALGWVFIKLPEPIMRMVVRVLALTLRLTLRNRCRRVKENLADAFPERSPEEIKAYFHLTTERTIELGLLGLVFPVASDQWIRDRLEISDAIRQMVRERADRPRPVIILPTHFSTLELLPAVPLIEPGLPLYVLYRDFDRESLEGAMHRSRERFGVRLLGRRRNLLTAAHALKDNGTVCIFFDQHVVDGGEPVSFFGRPAWGTTLMERLLKRQPAETWMLFPVRTGFWRCRIDVEPLKVAPEEVIGAATARLERQIRELGPEGADWLWLHLRWKEARKGRTVKTESPATPQKHPATPSSP